MLEDCLMDKRSSIRVLIVALSADYLAPDLDLGSTFIFICFHAFMMWLLMTDITSLHHYSASPLPTSSFTNTTWCRDNLKNIYL